MPIDPVKIPQNVYVEDRVVGPLTLKQLVIIGIGVGISYMFYAVIAQANGGSVPIPIAAMAWTPAAVFAIFALIKINDLTLFRIVLLSFEKFNNPNKRIWTPRRGLSIHIRTGATTEQDKADQQHTRKKTREEITTDRAHNISELSTVLDSTLELDEPEAPRPPATPAAGPVNPNTIVIDGTTANGSGGLSSFNGVFHDISPAPGHG